VILERAAGEQRHAFDALPRGPRRRVSGQYRGDAGDDAELADESGDLARVPQGRDGLDLRSHLESA
jgi:hypothetical protein